MWSFYNSIISLQEFVSSLLQEELTPCYAHMSCATVIQMVMEATEVHS